MATNRAPASAETRAKLAAATRAHYARLHAERVEPAYDPPLSSLELYQWIIERTTTYDRRTRLRGGGLEIARRYLAILDRLESGEGLFTIARDLGIKATHIRGGIANMARRVEGDDTVIVETRDFRTKSRASDRFLADLRAAYPQGMPDDVPVTASRALPARMIAIVSSYGQSPAAACVEGP